MKEELRKDLRSKWLAFELKPLPYRLSGEELHEERTRARERAHTEPLPTLVPVLITLLVCPWCLFCTVYRVALIEEGRIAPDRLTTYGQRFAAKRWAAASYVISPLCVLLASWALWESHWVYLTLLAIAVCAWMSRSLWTRCVLSAQLRHLSYWCLVELLLGFLLVGVLLGMYSTPQFQEWFPKLNIPLERLPVDQWDADDGKDLTNQVQVYLTDLPAFTTLPWISRAHNPFFWMYALALVYIMAAGWIIVMWIIHKLNRDLGLARRITVVVSCWLAVAGAFSCLYHDLYLIDTAKYNYFLLQVFSAVQQASRGETALALDGTKADANKDFKKLMRVIDPGVLAVLRARLLAHSAFAADRPTVVQQPGREILTKNKFWETFLFKTGNPAILPEVPLDVIASPPCQSNALVEAAYRKFLNELQSARLADTVYRVTIWAGADRRSFAHDAGANQRLAWTRAKAIQRRLISIAGDTIRSPHLDKLSAALNQSAVHDWYIEPATAPAIEQEYLLDLWPGRVLNTKPMTPKQDRARWRAGGVVIAEEYTNPAMVSAVMKLAEDGLTLQDLLYFSFVAGTTTGFGDIRPVSPLARRFVVLQMCIYVLLLGGALVSGIGSDSSSRHASLEARL